jgi:hypothetical protein
MRRPARAAKKLGARSKRTKTATSHGSRRRKILMFESFEKILGRIVR